jgi:hypothetical protein
MSIKLMMTWDIIPGREQEYFEFVVRDFVPGMQRLGLEPMDAWYTIYGDQPQILAAFSVETMPELQKTLRSEEWKSLLNQLLDYVTNYMQKIVPLRSGFQI